MSVRDLINTATHDNQDRYDPYNPRMCPISRLNQTGSGVGKEARSWWSTDVKMREVMNCVS